MKYIVNNSCIGCGMCAETCPEVFEMTGDRTLRAIDEVILEELESNAKAAMDGCPVGAIEEL